MLRKPRTGWFVEGSADPLNDEEARALGPPTRVRRTRFGGLPCACVSNEAYETLATVYERGAACSCEACPVKRLLKERHDEDIYEEEQDAIADVLASRGGKLSIVVWHAKKPVIKPFRRYLCMHSFATCRI